MTRRRKRNTKFVGPAASGDSHRADTRMVRAAQRAAWWRSNWKSVANFMVAAAIVMLVFVPWLGRFVDGQFFGLTGDYGTDFFRYSLGSAALLELDIDPYSNEQMYEALEAGSLATDHPNPYYDEQTSVKAFADTPEPIAKGVVSPPLLLVMIYPLLRACGYTFALNVWTVASLLGISWLSIQFWKKLMPPAPRWKHLASQSAMLSLLVLSSFPVLWSAIYGQFEVIYFLALGGAIYLWSFRRDRPATPLLIGLLLAIGGAIKLFPLLMLGYFSLRVVQEDRQPPNARWSARRLVKLPEAKVVVYGVAFFALLGLLTGVFLGFDVYASFLRKIADLQAEGSGPSMKGNLLSYLNFVPVWLSGPFTPMRRGVWVLYALISAGVVVILAISIRHAEDSQDSARDDPLQRLLEMTLLLAALPTILPHWWIYYNVILILPLMACFVAARATTDIRRRRWILSLTAMSFMLTFSYLTTAVFFGAFPDIYSVLINRPVIDAAIAQAAADPSLLKNLPYSSAFNEPYVAEFEGRVLSLFNLLYGYPGTVFLLLANWLALRSERRAGDHPQESSKLLWKNRRLWPRVAIPLTLAGGAVLSLAGGYAITWEGSRRLARAPHLEFVVDQATIDNPERLVEQMLARCQRAARQNENTALSGLIAELPPPNHFTTEMAQTEPRLATAMLRQDRTYFDDPAVVDKLLALFAKYQTNLNVQYATWAASGDERDLPNWRHHNHRSGMLPVLERKCREQSIPLRRVDQDWMLWQTQFLYEYAWQRALETLRRGDFIEFVKFIIEHRDSLSRHQALREARDSQLRASLSRDASGSGKSASFVYVQTPPYTSLSCYRACLTLDADTSLETGVRIGTLYVVEEILRRARLAKSDDPRESLSFARKAVSQIGESQIEDWWSEHASTGPAEILNRLSEDGLVELNQVDLEGLLIWDQPLAP